MVRLVGFLLLIVLIVLGLSFAVLNAQPVSLNYYLGYREVPLSIVVVLSLSVGAVIGALVGMGMILRLKGQASRLRKQLRQAEQAAEQMQILPAKK